MDYRLGSFGHGYLQEGWSRHIRPLSILWIGTAYINHAVSIYSWVIPANGYIPESKVHGANMGPTWGRQDSGGPHVGHMNLAIRDNIMLRTAVWRDALPMDTRAFQRTLVTLTTGADVVRLFQHFIGYWLVIVQQPGRVLMWFRMWVFMIAGTTTNFHYDVINTYWKRNYILMWVWFSWSRSKFR